MTFDWRSGGQYVSQTYRYLSESVVTQTWLDELVNPGDLGGAASQGKNGRWNSILVTTICKLFDK